MSQETLSHCGDWTTRLPIRKPMPHPVAAKLGRGRGMGEQSRALGRGAGAGGDWSHSGGRGGGGDALSRSSQGSSSGQCGARDKNRTGNRTGPGKLCAQQEPPPARHTVQCSTLAAWKGALRAGPIGVRTALRSPLEPALRTFW